MTFSIEKHEVLLIYINRFAGFGPPQALMLEQKSTSMLVTWSAPPPEGFTFRWKGDRTFF